MRRALGFGLLVAIAGLYGCASVGPWFAQDASAYRCRKVRAFVGLGEATFECRPCRDQSGKYATCDRDERTAEIFP